MRERDPSEIPITHSYGQEMLLYLPFTSTLGLAGHDKHLTLSTTYTETALTSQPGAAAQNVNTNKYCSRAHLYTLH